MVTACGVCIYDTLLQNPIKLLAFVVSVAGILTDYSSGRKIFFFLIIIFKFIYFLFLVFKMACKEVIEYTWIIFPLQQFFYAFLQDYVFRRFPISLCG